MGNVQVDLAFSVPLLGFRVEPQRFDLPREIHGTALKYAGMSMTTVRQDNRDVPEPFHVEHDSYV
ncbi:MAG: hypothetical protein OXQ29_26210 [Rhodospirillaceae bacterium]|nr:hypothetical protein [Rhodospirillaceae bacterium]